MAEALGYRDAYENTCEVLVSIAGLAQALYEITTEHPALNNPSPTSNAIFSLVNVIEEKVEQAQKRHRAEFDLVVKGASAERGK